MISLLCKLQRGGAIMWAIINVLYREYCLARMSEMRQFELRRDGRSKWTPN